MSGKRTFQSWTNSNYRQSSHPVVDSEVMWDDEPQSSVTQLTQAFCSQSLKNTVSDEWAARNSRGCEYQRDGMWQSGVSGQHRDMFVQQNESHRSSDETAPFEMKIEYSQVGLVIGKGGSRIKELQASSGAKINVKKNDPDAHGMVLVTLDGDETSRCSAKRLIDNLIENDNHSNAGRGNDFETRQTYEHFNDGGGFYNATQLTVASNMLGAIIGRGGQKIREIEKTTQARVKIGDNRWGATVEITITGNEDARQHAKILIDDVIQSESGTSSVPNSEKPNFAGRNSDNQDTFMSGSTQLQVPTSMLGAIIGRGGQMVKDISDKTQTRIKIGDDRSGGMVDVTVSGSVDGRQQARSLIEDIIQSRGSSFNSSQTNNQQRSGFGDFDHINSSQTSNQQRSGFGDFDHSESNNTSHSVPNSEEWGIGSCHIGSQQRAGFGSQQRAGFGDFDHSRPTERAHIGNSGRSSSDSFGSRNGFVGTSALINWDQVRELSQQHEQEKWKGYPPIKKNFYIEDPGVAHMDPEEVAAIRAENNKIMVSCDEVSDVSIPNPVRGFEEGFLHYPEILSELKRAGFTQPSPIQMQGWPIALQGLDLIGIAQTGTGKTLAFLLPAFIHIEGQPVPREKRGGPNVLVLSPTRELALQIEQEVKKYKYRDINCVCVYGGGNRREQIDIVTKGVEIVVATPGRLNDLISSNIIDVKSVTYLVLDEADRMLDLGFEPEIRKILIDIRPDRQTIMTSATWPAGVRRLATSYMKNPIRVFVGSLDLTAVHSVHQRVEIIQEEDKRSRLVEFLTQEMEHDDKAIVFVGRKCTVDSISSDFALSDIRCQSIHGGREQCDREQALDDLKDGVVRILIATDVASRGLDIKDVTHVVNFDFPRNIEEYVHRVGRTGRAGRSGESLTFMTRADWRHASELIKIMEEAQQEVPREIYDMAQRYSTMRDRRRNEDSNRSGGRGGFDDFSNFADNGRRGGRRDRERSLKVAYM